MKTITFADLQALAIDTDSLPPMSGRTGKARKSDAKRGKAARRETLARRQARELKTRELIEA
jgi:hypothetical protein